MTITQAHSRTQVRFRPTNAGTEVATETADQAVYINLIAEGFEGVVIVSASFYNPDNRASIANLAILETSADDGDADPYVLVDALETIGPVPGGGSSHSIYAARVDRARLKKFARITASISNEGTEGPAVIHTHGVIVGTNKYLRGDGDGFDFDD